MAQLGAAQHWGGLVGAHAVVQADDSVGRRGKPCFALECFASAVMSSVFSELREVFVDCLLGASSQLLWREGATRHGWRRAAAQGEAGPGAPLCSVLTHLLKIL